MSISFGQYGFPPDVDASRPAHLSDPATDPARNPFSLINKIRLTGDKLGDKVYVRYTGYPGGQRFITPKELLAKHPERIIEKAVRGMLPKNRLGRQLFKNLYVYAGRRKTAVARIYLTAGSGNITVNGKDYKTYFPTLPLQYIVTQSTEVAGAAGNYDVNVNVNGGGVKGQAEAVRLAIAKALIELDATEDQKMARTTYQDLLDAGVHFGHLTRKWDPKMAKYIFMERNGIHIIDLNKTLTKLEEAASAIKQIVKSGRKVLFVATKKQAKEIIAQQAKEVNMPFVTERWLGGMLTNFATVRKSIKKMSNIDKMQKDGTYDVLSKKEKLMIQRERIKLESLLGGIADLNRLPAALFIIDVKKEHIAGFLKQSKLNIPYFCNGRYKL
ncbi:hypothetical protein FQR65_LT15609 [Abscondita terminalis]|nr:hypothetical protein FQR65_LT15609 [Abscondita terminalis]